MILCISIIHTIQYDNTVLTILQQTQSHQTIFSTCPTTRLAAKTIPINPYTAEPPSVAPAHPRHPSQAPIRRQSDNQRTEIHNVYYVYFVYKRDDDGGTYIQNYIIRRVAFTTHVSPPYMAPQNDMADTSLISKSLSRPADNGTMCV